MARVRRSNGHLAEDCQSGRGTHVHASGACFVRRVVARALAQERQRAIVDWLEISLAVNGELAEAVAEVLSRFAPNGVMTEQGIRHVGDEDTGTPDGPVVVRAYLPQDATVGETRREIERALHFLGMIQPLPPPTLRAVPDTNWMEAWKQHYRPILIGERLVVLPAWLDSRDPTRVAVKIDPGMAFGTGTHPSTQLCLEFLDEILRAAGEVGDPGRADTPSAFIDVGCGSGILSIAALKLGVSTALAVDIDADSITNARENARANGVGPELQLSLGSVQEILAGAFVLRSAPLVAANILAPVILRLLDEGLARLVTAGGSMILAGILAAQTLDVEQGCRNAGLTVVDRRTMGDWVAMRVTR